MTNHKSKARKLLKKFNPKLEAWQVLPFWDELTEALREAELSGARKMREKATEEALKHRSAEAPDQELPKEISDAISQLSPESVVEG